MSFEILHSYTRAVLYESDTAGDVKTALIKAVKGGADLRGADLGGADLRGADLGGADLEGADLRGADLGGADLRGADLGGADLEGANLRGAHLEGAHLRGAHLRGADLRGADLGGAKGITPKVLQILGSHHPLIVREYGKVSIGCMSNTLEWWEDHYAGVGRSEGYGQEAIEEYREHIASARKFMERYSLMVAPKEATE